jgi:excisionase family DNA binding protein
LISEFKSENYPHDEVEHRLMTVQDAARYLAVSVSTLYGWVYQRRIPFVKVGRALRFDMADINRFVELNKTQSRPCRKNTSN